MENHYEIALSFAMEDYNLVEKVYHYLKAESIDVFFSPSQESQVVLSGKNQREIFYSIFGMNTDFVALFVTESYIAKDVTMEEAGIAFAKHGCNGTVIPVYLDDAELPTDMFDPKNMNYFRSNNPAAIANHLASKVKSYTKKKTNKPLQTNPKIQISGNDVKNQIFIESLEGNLNL